MGALAIMRESWWREREWFVGEPTSGRAPGVRRSVVWGECGVVPLRSWLESKWRGNAQRRFESEGRIRLKRRGAWARLTLAFDGGKNGYERRRR